MCQLDNVLINNLIGYDRVNIGIRLLLCRESILILEGNNRVGIQENILG